MEVKNGNFKDSILSTFQPSNKSIKFGFPKNTNFGIFIYPTNFINFDRFLNFSVQISFFLKNLNFVFFASMIFCKFIKSKNVIFEKSKNAKISFFFKKRRNFMKILLIFTLFSFFSLFLNFYKKQVFQALSRERHCSHGCLGSRCRIGDGGRYIHRILQFFFEKNCENSQNSMIFLIFFEFSQNYKKVLIFF